MCKRPLVDAAAVTGQDEPAACALGPRRRFFSRISPAELADGIRRTPLDHFVIWTGDTPQVQPNSRIGRALACIDAPGVPVSLRELVQRAARMEGEYGVTPDAVRNAVRQHQMAQAAVLLLLARRPCGDLVAVTDIPFASGGLRRVRAGDVVVSARDAVRAAAARAPRAVGGAYAAYG
jgi:hypothetical protein